MANKTPAPVGGAILTGRALNRATLARQFLIERTDTKPIGVIERLVAMQAQWPKPPFVGLWTRVRGFRREALGDLVRKRTAVRATSLRGTLHVMTSRDYPWLRATLDPMLARGLQAILRDRMQSLDLDAIQLLARTRFGAGGRTFEDIRDHLMTKFPKGDERAMGYAVRMLLPLVQVPTDATWGYPAIAEFALAESWLGRSIEAAPDPALLVRRYLAAFGPATATDVQTWSGVQGLREVLETLRPSLVTFRDERNRELFDLADAPRPPEDTPVPVRFLPEFDNILIGHDDRRRMVADEHRPAVYLPGLRVAPTVLVDGVVAGSWAVTRKKHAATLTVEPFAAWSKGARADVLTEGDALVRFVEPEATTFEVHVAAARRFG